MVSINSPSTPRLPACPDLSQPSRRVRAPPDYAPSSTTPAETPGSPDSAAFTRNATSLPFASTTLAPASARHSCWSELFSSHGSKPPYGFAGSEAARCTVSTRSARTPQTAQHIHRRRRRKLSSALRARLEHSPPHPAVFFHCLWRRIHGRISATRTFSAAAVLTHHDAIAHQHLLRHRSAPLRSVRPGDSSHNSHQGPSALRRSIASPPRPRPLRESPANPAADTRATSAAFRFLFS